MLSLHLQPEHQTLNLLDLSSVFYWDQLFLVGWALFVFNWGKPFFVGLVDQPFQQSANQVETVEKAFA